VLEDRLRLPGVVHADVLAEDEEPAREIQETALWGFSSRDGYLLSDGVELKRFIRFRSLRRRDIGIEVSQVLLGFVRCIMGTNYDGDSLWRRFGRTLVVRGTPQELAPDPGGGEETMINKAVISKPIECAADLIRREG
jgi:hypothetical protein